MSPRIFSVLSQNLPSKKEIREYGGLGDIRKEKNKMQQCIKCWTYIKCTCPLRKEVSVLVCVGTVMILCCLEFCLSKELLGPSEFKGRAMQAKACRWELLPDGLGSLRLCPTPLQEGGRQPTGHLVYHLVWLARRLPWYTHSWVPGQRQWLRVSHSVIAAGKTRLGSSLEVFRTWGEGKRR